MSEGEPVDPAGGTGGDLGLFAAPGGASGHGASGLGAAGVAAAALSALWLLMALGFFLFAGDTVADAATWIMVLAAILFPVLLIWVAALTLGAVREMRAQAERLQASAHALRQAAVARRQAGPLGASIEKRIEEIAAATAKTESAIALFTSRRDSDLVQPSADRKAALVTPAPSRGTEEQPALALGTPAEALAAPISVADFVKALNFPDNPHDKDGFRALRLALEDRSLSRLIRAAQDTLTLLSQDGIYMDDLRPDRTRPELWRRFAAGERGRAIAALGGVRDRSSLALTAARMRRDPVFRDAAHHFLRQFDKTLAEFEKNAADADLVALSETRSARAFMLIGRVAGLFD
ncbi:hypothetical protein [Albidovulum sp.]